VRNLIGVYCISIHKRLTVTTLALGSRPKQGLATLQAKREACQSHLMLPGVQKNVREWTLTFLSELPFWELKSWWIPESSKSDCRGQNQMDWKVFYTIKYILECKWLKWFHLTHLDTWNVNYGQKTNWESNRQFDSWPIKVNNRSDFLMCMWHAPYHWKDLNEAYNFASDLISIGGLHTMLWDPKGAGIPIVAISGLPFESPRTKCHLDVGLVERHKIYYKGEGDGFSQIWAMVSLVSSSLPMARSSTKSASTMH
jgi:hypothetical protein